MELTHTDKSNYLKGLLILIGKDRTISKNEKEFFRKLAKILNFSSEFCEQILNELLENEYFIEEPPIFSKNEIAKLFIIDGIRIAFSDKILHLYEMNWLKSVADKNGINEDWCLEKFEEFENDKNDITQYDFEIAKVIKDSE